MLGLSCIDETLLTLFGVQGDRVRFLAKEDMLTFDELGRRAIY